MQCFNRWITAIFCSAIILLGLNSLALAKDTQSSLTPDEARAIAKDAYIFNPIPPLLIPPPREPTATSPLFPRKQPAFPQFDQQGRLEKPLGLDPCVLPLRNEQK